MLRIVTVDTLLRGFHESFCGVDADRKYCEHPIFFCFVIVDKECTVREFISNMIGDNCSNIMFQSV